jgi:hypothetical protein
MAEKSSGKKVFEKMFVKFEKRKDEKFKVPEELKRGCKHKKRCPIPARKPSFSDET